MTIDSTTPAFVQLVFCGEILRGHEPEDAKRRLAAAIGIAPGRIEDVFSGRRVVLKRSLPVEEAPRYLAKLERIGIVARVEALAELAPELSAGLVAACETSSGATARAAPQLSLVADAPDGAASAPAEEIVCPKCGASQPKRTLCLSCSTDMPRYAAAQKTLGEEQRAARLAALRASAEDGSTSTSVSTAEYAAETASLFGSDFAGRIGRTGYLTGGLVVGAIGVAGAVVSLRTGVWLLVIPLLLGTLFASLRLAVLRCHDLGWSGWWSLLFLVPYAGSLFSLVLLIVPGTRGNNAFGRASRPPGMPTVAASLAVLVIACLWGFSQTSKLVPMLAQYRAQTSGNSAVSPMTSADYDPANNAVIMYSLSTCGYCVAKRRELDDLGIRYTERFLDGGGNADQELSSLLKRAGMPERAYGTPILDVNGEILPNNPPIEEIVRHLRGSKS